jgi:hypothetical protein
VEFEVDGGNEGGAAVAENDSRQDHEGSVRNAPAVPSRIKTKTDKATSIEAIFLRDCRRWRRTEVWKNKWWNGDMGEQGTKLMAESRWANTKR